MSIETEETKSNFDPQDNTKKKLTLNDYLLIGFAHLFESCSFISGGYHGYMDGYNIPITTPYVESALIYGPSLLGGIAYGIPYTVLGYTYGKSSANLVKKLENHKQESALRKGQPLPTPTYWSSLYTRLKTDENFRPYFTATIGAHLGFACGCLDQGTKTALSYYAVYWLSQLL